MIESFRNLKDGTITVRTPNFTVVVSESEVKIQIAETTVDSWKPGTEHTDTPSPRAATSNRKRGSR